MIDTGRADHSHLIHLLLVVKYRLSSIPIADEHLDLVLLVLLELSQLLLLWLHEDLLEDHLILLLALSGEGSVG